MSQKKINIVYEDKNIIVVNKEANLLSVATDKEKEKTLYHQVLEYLKRKNQKVFIVHRLDKDTSGLIIFAKNERIKSILQNNWNDLVKKREYIGIVEGNVEKNSDIIRSYLKENSEYISYSTDNKKEGKLAITRYKKIKCNNKYSVLKINILTGRKNQIRVHMKDIGHPIVGDIKYGYKNKLVNRLMLHANRLEFIHPVTKEFIVLENALPKEFKILMDKMEVSKNVRDKEL